MSATAQLQAVAHKGLVQAPPPECVWGTPVPEVGAKQQCHSSDQSVPTLRQDQGVTDIDDVWRMSSQNLKGQKAGRKGSEEAPKRGFF